MDFAPCIWTSFFPNVLVLKHILACCSAVFSSLLLLTDWEEREQQCYLCCVNMHGRISLRSIPQDHHRDYWLVCLCFERTRTSRNQASWQGLTTQREKNLQPWWEYCFDRRAIHGRCYRWFWIRKPWRSGSGACTFTLVNPLPSSPSLCWAYVMISLSTLPLSLSLSLSPSWSLSLSLLLS